MVISELGVLKSREGDIFELDFAGGEMTLFQQKTVVWYSFLSLVFFFFLFGLERVFSGVELVITLQLSEDALSRSTS